MASASCALWLKPILVCLLLQLRKLSPLLQVLRDQLFVSQLRRPHAGQGISEGLPLLLERGHPRWPRVWKDEIL